MRNIDKTGLPGKYKAWIFQHGLLPRLTWPLMLYEIGVTTVEGLGRTINRHLRRWLGVPPSFSSIGLYSRTSKLQLPFTSLVEEYKVGKARLIMTLKTSKDEKVRQAGVHVRTGRKWSASRAVEDAESRLRHKDIVGTVCQGRQGLGTTHRQSWRTTDTGERRGMVQSEIRAQEEEGRKKKAVEMGCQGAWTRWETEERHLTWKDIWRYQPAQLKFLLRSVYDVLPSPVNLHRWGLVPDPDCVLCGKRGTLDHVLTSCQTALTQGRYTWRHNEVLRELADILERERKAQRKVKKKMVTIRFVKEGQSVPVQGTNKKSGLLEMADDWTMEVDLHGRSSFPNIVQTSLRPDIVLWSRGEKKLLLVELTVPWEERCVQANERKRAKYEDLLAECWEQVWQTWNFPVEVGYRGFPAQSVWRTLSALGLTGLERRRAVQRLAQAAERASSWVWRKREESTWKPTVGAQ
ncbi:uncharacterized protein LOC117334822 [Pecten maximus]|uniref:uncharacterized protein LOC117334822 n=1 Tax=Pecten maximus TaxID=6579 RepID=UPI001458060B|nr:uncharacterized protein LOC117334822 [Pecten maximus]